MHRAIVLASACAVLAGCELHGPASGTRTRTFAIANRSSHVLTEIRLAPIAERDWEASLVPALHPGDEVAAAPIACARYDVLFVDDAAGHCILPMQPLCFGNEAWQIDDVTLAACRWTR